MYLICHVNFKDHVIKGDATLYEWKLGSKLGTANYESFFVCPESKATFLQLFNDPLVTHMFQNTINMSLKLTKLRRTQQPKYGLLPSLFTELVWHVIAQCNTDKSNRISVICDLCLRQLSCLHQLIINALATNVSHHIETSQLICTASQLTGFYMVGNFGR